MDLDRIHVTIGDDAVDTPPAGGHHVAITIKRSYIDSKRWDVLAVGARRALQEHLMLRGETEYGVEVKIERAANQF